MELPERFVLTIEGKLWNVCRRNNVARGALPHLLSELLTGKHCHEAADALAAFGLRVTIEMGTDQGDDGPDELSIRA